MSRVLASAAALVLAVGLAAQPTAGARPDAASTRVIDRTLLCSTLAIGGGLYEERNFLKTRAMLESAYLAVRTRDGRPLAFAAVFRSGQARLYAAAGCFAD